MRKFIVVQKNAETGKFEAEITEKDAEGTKYVISREGEDGINYAILLHENSAHLPLGEVMRSASFISAYLCAISPLPHQIGK